MPKKTSTVPIRNVVIVSDTHVGCCLGLLSPNPKSNDDGGPPAQSALQKKVWAYWEEFWGDWVPRVTKKEPYIVVHNGDVMDGVHHQATTQWSHNMGDQNREAIRILKPVVELCEGRYYQIRGTEAHVGKSATYEEDVATALEAIPNEQGQHARWELWLRIGGSDGPLIHFLHHIGNTSSGQHETSALNAEIAAIYLDCGKFSREPPMFVVRSHRHRCSEVRLPVRSGYCTCFVTPCWQLRTPFSWKIAGARVTSPQIGGSLIRIGDEEGHTRHFVRDIERSKEECV